MHAPSFHTGSHLCWPSSACLLTATSSPSSSRKHLHRACDLRLTRLQRLFSCGILRRSGMRWLCVWRNCAYLLTDSAQTRCVTCLREYVEANRRTWDAYRLSTSSRYYWRCWTAPVRSARRCPRRSRCTTLCMASMTASVHVRGCSPVLAAGQDARRIMRGYLAGGGT